jgi:hypothetical protein
VIVHSVLPDTLRSAAGRVLAAAGVEHVAHDDGDPVSAAATAAGDARAVALLGPFRSADVAEAVEATAPAGLPLLAPVATWAGVTRDDEPGCDHAARHGGTVLRLVARDTEVAARLAADVRANGRRALVVAGRHDYGLQLDGQLRMAGLPRAEAARDADLVVLCGLAGEPEVDRARAAGDLPLVAFDGVQGADLGAGHDVEVALPFAPAGDEPFDHLVDGARQAHRAARLVVAGLRDGARDRAALLRALREGGAFDAHGDPVAPPVWLWRAGPDWALRAGRPL